MNFYLKARSYMIQISSKFQFLLLIFEDIPRLLYELPSDDVIQWSNKRSPEEINKVTVFQIGSGATKSNSCCDCIQDEYPL